MVSDVTIRSKGGASNGTADVGEYECEAIAFLLVHVHLSGGTVQSSSRISINPEPVGRAAEFCATF